MDNGKGQTEQQSAFIWDKKDGARKRRWRRSASTQPAHSQPISHQNIIVRQIFKHHSVLGESESMVSDSDAEAQALEEESFIVDIHIH